MRRHGRWPVLALVLAGCVSLRPTTMLRGPVLVSVERSVVPPIPMGDVLPGECGPELPTALVTEPGDAPSGCAYMVISPARLRQLEAAAVALAGDGGDVAGCRASLGACWDHVEDQEATCNDAVDRLRDGLADADRRCVDRMLGVGGASGAAGTLLGVGLSR